MADGQPQPQATNRRCRAGFRVWALVLGMAIVAGCSSPRIAAPSAEPDPSAPEFVAVPDDPADDPQLQAVALPPDRPGTPASTTIESKVPDLQRLKTLTRSVKAELGPGVKALLVEVGGVSERLRPCHRRGRPVADRISRRDRVETAPGR